MQQLHRQRLQNQTIVKTKPVWGSLTHGSSFTWCSPDCTSTMGWLVGWWIEDMGSEREANKENWKDCHWSSWKWLLSRHDRHPGLYRNHKGWSLSPHQCREAHDQGIAAVPAAWQVQESVCMENWKCLPFQGTNSLQAQQRCCLLGET